MLALRLARAGQPLVQLRRLLVASASAGTGFLLLCTLGHAMTHPESSTASVLRLAWCVAPLAATVYFAVAVARTDPGTRPRPGLSAIGLGPGRLTAISATTTALATTLGSTLALLLFLHLRGDLTGMPFDGAAADFLAADRPLPLPAALTLLSLVPIAASAATALALRPRAESRARGRRHTGGSATRPGGGPAGQHPVGAQAGPGEPGTPAAAGAPVTADTLLAPAPQPAADASATPADHPGRPGGAPDPRGLVPAQTAPGGLPWGAAVVAVGLAVETYASRSDPTPGLALPGGFAGGPAGVLVGWALTAVGLALAGPALTHLCGLLLQSVRPGALRLIAGRVLQTEARRIGQPLGVLCAVASGAYAMATLYSGERPDFGPLSTLGALVVGGCTLLTLVTAAVEARQARADTTAALLRLGAPVTMLRSAAALRVGALLAVFGPLTWVVAQLAALPLTR
ncbi:hypothetical protein [Streptomyces sp. NPDC005907]|uniref:hypothetical protein n=1 Tax=Streptomyces sp. NPDC005907 TaxID=3154571 RepID=UPI0033C0E0AE